MDDYSTQPVRFILYLETVMIIDSNSIPDTTFYDTPMDSTHSSTVIGNTLLLSVSPKNAPRASSNKAWDDMNVVMSLERARKKPLSGRDLRYYPKSHDRYDLAELIHWKKLCSPFPSQKAESKYNIEKLVVIDAANTHRHIESFNTSNGQGGTPGYIDAFFKGEPGGRTEGYALRPDQFITTSFHPKHGGFLISPNPSSIPEKGKTYINDASTILENTRSNGTGFGLICYWVPPSTYERYPVFRAVFPDTKIPECAPQINAQANSLPNRQERLFDTENNNAYAARTGCTFLSIPLNLQKEHTPLLKELKSTVIEHLEKIYGCDPKKEKVEIYSHGPIYDIKTCGLHFHVRVNEGRHPLESDLRYLDLEEAIAQLNNHGKITHNPITNSGHFISYNIAAKTEKATENGIAFTAIPNPWKRPGLKKHNPDFKSLNEKIGALTTHSTMPQPLSVKKYDISEVGIISPAGMDKRISMYADNEILPNFIYDFILGKNKKKVDAFLRHPEQFPATSFGDHGGIFLMPNPKYVVDQKDYFNDPRSVLSETRYTGGISLVGYWVPPEVFADISVLEKLFDTTNFGHSSTDHRESVAEYNQRTGKTFIVNPIDLKKEHLPLLLDSLKLCFEHLKDTYNFDPNKDHSNIYLHAPLYGDKTAGFHFHVRVNQHLPAGEWDANRLGLQEVISILQDETILNEDLQPILLSKSLKTNKGNYYSFSAAWDKKAQSKTKPGYLAKKQFNNIAVTFIPNPWRTPAP